MFPKNDNDSYPSVSGKVAMGCPTLEAARVIAYAVNKNRTPFGLRHSDKRRGMPFTVVGFLAKEVGRVPSYK